MFGSGVSGSETDPTPPERNHTGLEGTVRDPVSPVHSTAGNAVMVGAAHPKLVRPVFPDTEASRDNQRMRTGSPQASLAPYSLSLLSVCL